MPRYPSTCWRSRGSSNRLCRGRSCSYPSLCSLCLFFFFFIFLLCFFAFRGEKNFHIFYYIYAGLYHQNKLKSYRLPDKTPPRLAQQQTLLRLHSQNSPRCVSGRYIDSQHCRVMQDIVSSKLYTEQFDAIQDCFRIIGFTEEVT